MRTPSRQLECPHPRWRSSCSGVYCASLMKISAPSASRRKLRSYSRSARLIVGGVNDRAHRSFDSKSEAALRMIQPAGGDARFPYAKAVSAGNFGEIALRGHRLEVHREIRMRHLRLKNALQAVAVREIPIENCKSGICSALNTAAQKTECPECGPSGNASPGFRRQSVVIGVAPLTDCPASADRCRNPGSTGCRPA